jgi:NTP pyrophosphatase (non-canonical NTP hydrolase)
MALGGELGELLTELQWLTDEQVRSGLAEGDLRARVQDEVADIFIYLIRLADVSGIDLLDAATEKLKRNESRYRADVVRGSADRSLRDRPSSDRAVD